MIVPLYSTSSLPTKRNEANNHKLRKTNQNWFKHLPSEFYDCLAEQPAVSIERVNLDRHFRCLLIDEAAIVEVGYDILCMNTGDSLVQIDKKVISLRRPSAATNVVIFVPPVLWSYL